MLLSLFLMILTNKLALFVFFATFFFVFTHTHSLRKKISFIRFVGTIFVFVWQFFFFGISNRKKKIFVILILILCIYCKCYTIDFKNWIFFSIQFKFFFGCLCLWMDTEYRCNDSYSARISIISQRRLVFF